MTCRTFRSMVPQRAAGDAGTGFAAPSGTPKGAPSKGAAIPSPSRQGAAALTDLAHRVRRLTIDRRDPEKFHSDKSELAHDLLALARGLEVTNGRT